jgi:hypothetical protein
MDTNALNAMVESDFVRLVAERIEPGALSEKRSIYLTYHSN